MFKNFHLHIVQPNNNYIYILILKTIFILQLWTPNLVKYIRYVFSSNHNIHKSSCGLCFWSSDTLVTPLAKRH